MNTWLLVEENAAGTLEVLRRHTAETIADARTFWTRELRYRGGLTYRFVQSEASFALGISKPLRPDRCTACGTKPRIEGKSLCAGCQDVHRLNYRQALNAQGDRSRGPGEGRRAAGGG